MRCPLKTFSTAILTFALATASSAAVAISWNQPLTLASNVGTADPQVAIVAERFGANRGRLHVAFVGANAQNGTTVYYLRETGVGTSVFQPVKALSSQTAARTVTSPDIAIDGLGVAHVCWIETISANQAVVYARANDSAIDGPVQVSPVQQTSASSPAIAAVQLTGDFAPRAYIAYVGDDLSAESDSEVLVMGNSPSNPFTFEFPVNLTFDTIGGDTNVSFDLIRSLGGASAVQGSIVFERASNIYAIPLTGSSPSSIIFGLKEPVRLNPTGILAFQPSVTVQSVFDAANGWVGHVTYRGSESGLVGPRYLQFARLPNASDFNIEPGSGLPFSNAFTYPSTIVVPDTVVEARWDKPASIVFFDNTSSSLSAARNSGGISSLFGLLAVGGSNPKPITSFSNDVGTLNLSPLPSSEGPRLVANTPFSGTDRLRVVARQGSNLVLINEFPLPNPTPTPTATPSPTPTAVPSPTPTRTPSPTATATQVPTPTTTATATASASPTPSPTATFFPPTPSPTRTGTPSPTSSPTVSPTFTPSPSPTPLQSVTPTPDTVNAAEIIDTMLGLLPTPTAERFPRGDFNGDFVWDVADAITTIRD